MSWARTAVLLTLCWAAQPSQELWLYNRLIAVKWKWPDNLTSVRGIFIFNWLRWSFRPWSFLYFRWHLTALTDIFFIFFIHKISPDHAIKTAIKTLLPMRVIASPSLCATFEIALVWRNDSRLDKIYSNVKVQQVVHVSAREEQKRRITFGKK